MVFVLLATGCSPAEESRCVAGDDIEISVGGAVYTVPDERLVSISPEGASSGLIVAPRQSARGQQVRYCRDKAGARAQADSILLDLPGIREVSPGKPRRLLVDIIAPGRLAAEARPSFPVIHSDEIAGIDYGRIIGKPNDEVRIPIRISLNGHRTQEISVRCGWTDLPYGRPSKGSWIATCRPIFPLDDGNYLEISTGGMPEEHLTMMGDDIRHALRSVESLAKDGARQ